MSKLTCVLVGAGIRGRQYVDHAAKIDPDFNLVAIAEPDIKKRDAFADKYNIPSDMRFASWEELLDKEKLADCAINATGDWDHCESAVAMMDMGYDMLLEKPITPNKADTLKVAEAAKRNDVRVMICHVLRYTPFYTRVNEILHSNRIGKILQIRMTENVSWHHFGTAFVRGRFRNAEVGAPFILAKTCHDLDLMMWLMHGNAPKNVLSAGSLMFYTEQNAPEGSTQYCDDCPHVDTCAWSSDALYIKSDTWAFRVMDDFNGTDDEKRALLRKNGFAKCVWRCDNDVVDHQSVIVEFENGATGTLETNGVSARATREFHIFGTNGELKGDMVSNIIKVRESSHDGTKFSEEIIDINAGSADESDGHGGGDAKLMADFVRVMRGEGENLTCITDSVNGHLVGYAAEEARKTGKRIDL